MSTSHPADTTTGDQYHPIAGIPDLILEMGRLSPEDRKALNNWTLVADPDAVSREQLERAVLLLRNELASTLTTVSSIRSACIRDVLKIEGGRYRLAYVSTRCTQELIASLVDNLLDLPIRVVPEGANLSINSTTASTG